MGFRTFAGKFGRSPAALTALFSLGSGLLPGVLVDVAQAQSAEVVAECNQLAEVINQNQAILTEFEAEINNFAQNASQAETLADIQAAASQYVEAVDTVTTNLGGLITDLEGLAIADSQLSAYRNDYVIVVGGFNDALDLVSTAMNGVATVASEAELPEQLDMLQTDTTVAVGQIDELATDEADIINNINLYCGTTPEGE
jgi:signal transduction histidine kinase